MAGLSGIVKKISDLVTGTPADDDCFIFGKTDLKKITLAKLKDALGIQSNQTFVEQWIDGMTRYEVIISFDDIDIFKTNRIPVLIGGNINNAPFLYMYNFDLPNLPQNATVVEGTPILQISQTFYVTGNKDGGNSRRLRILFNNQSNAGAHVYIDVKVCGGKVIGTNTYPPS